MRLKYYRKTVLTTLVMMAAMLVLPSSYAALVNFSQNFEALDRSDPAALSSDGWLVFANVFDTDKTTLLYNYGVDPAPNGGAGFSSVTGGYGDIDQGAQQLTVFNDYNNTDHASGKWIETFLYQQQMISAADAGATVSFVFHAKQGYISGDSTAQAFIKTLDPDAGSAITNNILLDTTSLATAWDTYTLKLMIPDDNSLDGQLLQFGFSTFASSYQSSDNFYDNIDFSGASVVPVPGAVWLMMSGLIGLVGVARRH